MTAATGCDYSVVHAAFAKHGRKARKGCNFQSTGAAVARELGYHMTRLGPHQYSAKTMISAAKDRALRSGHYVAKVRGHVAAIVDGKIIDWTQGRRHRIIAIFEFTPIAAKAADLPTGSAKWLAFTKYTKHDQINLF